MVSVVVSLDRKVYCNHDVIHGEVVIENDAPRHFHRLDVKLECVSRTRIRERRGELTITYREKHRLLYKVLRVLPSADRPEFEAVNGQVNVPVGVHTFPFSFTFPLDNSTENVEKAKMRMFNHVHTPCALPPLLKQRKVGTTGDNVFKVEYFVKAVLKNDHTFSRTVRGQSKFRFVPVQLFPRVETSGAVALRYILGHHTFSKMPVFMQKDGAAGPLKKLFFGREKKLKDSGIEGVVRIPPGDKRLAAMDVKVTLDMRFGPCLGIVFNGRPTFQFYLLVLEPPLTFQLPDGVLSGLGFLQLVEMTVLLVNHVFITARRHTRKRKNLYPIVLFKGMHELDLASCEPSTHHPGLWELLVPPEAYNAPQLVVHERMVVPFNVCNINSEYGLRAELRFKGGENDKRKLFGMMDRHWLKLDEETFPVYQEAPGREPMEWFVFNGMPEEEPVPGVLAPDEEPVSREQPDAALSPSYTAPPADDAEPELSGMMVGGEIELPPLQALVLTQQRPDPDEVLPEYTPRMAMGHGVLR